MSALTLLTASCSAVEPGVVIAKGDRFGAPNFGMKPVYWVDVRPDDDASPKQARVFVFQQQWRQIKVGDRFPAGSKPAPTRRSRSFKSKKFKRPTAHSPSPTPQPDPAKTEEKNQPHPQDIQARAMEDPEVRAWKKKAHEAKTDEEQQRALREYQNALARKIRESDPPKKPADDSPEEGVQKLDPDTL